MADLDLKQNDTASVEATLPDDLTDATEVRFQLSESAGGDAVIDSVAVIQNASEGIVRYDWSNGETDKTGLYYLEWRVEWSDGNIETYPKDGYSSVYFHRDQQ